MPTVHCTREGCERTFTTDHGLAVHLARSHKDADHNEDHHAIDAAENQPTELEVLEVLAAEDLEVSIRLEGDEQDLLDAVCFLFNLTAGEVAAEAMTMYFEWARNDARVRKAIALRNQGDGDA